MKQTLHIPETLKDIKLKDYQKFLAIAEDSDEQFIREKMIQIFCGVELKYINHISNKDFQEITNSITKVLYQTPELTPYFSLKGVEYGFIPNLDKMSIGEFIDLDNHIGDWSKIDVAMSVLYRPITERKGSKYRIEAYKGDVNPDFKDMPLDVVIGSMLFFWSLSNELLNYIMNYLPQVAEGEKVREILIKNGVGISQLTPSLTGIISELKKSLTQTFTPLSFIYVTSETKQNHNLNK